MASDVQPFETSFLSFSLLILFQNCQAVTLATGPWGNGLFSIYCVFQRLRRGAPVCQTRGSTACVVCPSGCTSAWGLRGWYRVWGEQQVQVYVLYVLSGSITPPWVRVKCVDTQLWIQHVISYRMQFSICRKEQGNILYFYSLKPSTLSFHNRTYVLSNSFCARWVMKWNRL